MFVWRLGVVLAPRSWVAGLRSSGAVNGWTLSVSRGTTEQGFGKQRGVKKRLDGADQLGSAGCRRPRSQWCQSSAAGPVRSTGRGTQLTSARRRTPARWRVAGHRTTRGRRESADPAAPGHSGVDGDALGVSRVDVRWEPLVVRDGCRPGRIPAGRWPSDGALVRSEQFAVNEASRSPTGACSRCTRRPAPGWPRYLATWSPRSSPSEPAASPTCPVRRRPSGNCAPGRRTGSRRRTRR